jgi:hypothetical protein
MRWALGGLVYIFLVVAAPQLCAQQVVWVRSGTASEGVGPQRTEVVDGQPIHELWAFKDPEIQRFRVRPPGALIAPLTHPSEVSVAIARSELRQVHSELLGRGTQVRLGGRFLHGMVAVKDRDSRSRVLCAPLRQGEFVEPGEER